MSETQVDAAATTEQAVVTNTDTGETVATDSGTEQASAEQVAELTDEQKAEQAAADAKAAAEAEAEKARVEAAVEAFKALIGTYETDEASPDFGKTLSGVLASEERDITTGQLPDGVLNDLRAKFNEVPPGAARTKIKHWNDAQISVAMDDARLIGIARSLFLIKKVVLVAAAGAKAAAPKVAVDPTEAFVNQMLAAYLAPYMAQVPEGVDANWADKVNALVTSENAELSQSYAANMDALAKLPADDADEATDETKAKRAELTAATEKAPEFIKAGFRLIRGRTANVGAPKKARATKSADGTTTSAPRQPRAAGTNKSTGAHIVEALASVPVGQVMSVADIVNFRSNEYGDEKPSPGAVSARLWPGTGGGDGDKCTLPNIKGVLTSTGNKGGVRTA